MHACLISTDVRAHTCANHAQQASVATEKAAAEKAKVVVAAALNAEQKAREALRMASAKVKMTVEDVQAARRAAQEIVAAGKAAGLKAAAAKAAAAAAAKESTAATKAAEEAKSNMKHVAEKVKSKALHRHQAAEKAAASAAPPPTFSPTVHVPTSFEDSVLNYTPPPLREASNHPEASNVGGWSEVPPPTRSPTRSPGAPPPQPPMPPLPPLPPSPPASLQSTHAVTAPTQHGTTG